MPKQQSKTLKKRSSAAAKRFKKSALIDRTTYVAAIVEPIITIPQAADIFVHHTAAGISLSSWIGYELLTAVWVWYAIVHKDRLILIYNAMYFVVQTVIIIGGFMYGARW
jgi:uncharacterized protein with PQ loop repeat